MPEAILSRLRRFLTGHGNGQWCRVVMDRETRKLVAPLGPSRLSALEISGNEWPGFGFHSYRQTTYPEYDVCAGPLAETFDIVIAEQVFEHVLWPYRAGRNVHAMVKPGGHFLLTTPFLCKVHWGPEDCTRWTETGLRHFLAECGFPLQGIVTGSWGNRDCIVANFDEWAAYVPWRHSLRNEPSLPYMVWALARKA